MTLFRKHINIDNNLSFDCWVFSANNKNSVNEFWFRTNDIVEFINYKDTKIILDCVHQDWKCTWEDLKRIHKNYYVLSVVRLEESPFNWTSDTMFITEPGLYTLLNYAGSPKDMILGKMMLTKVLPALRQEAHQNSSTNDCSGFVYLASTPNYLMQNIYKIGYTMTLQKRLDGFNAVCSDDFYKYIAAWPIDDLRKMDEFGFITLRPYQLPNGFYQFKSESEAMTCLESLTTIVNSEFID